MEAPSFKRDVEEFEATKIIQMLHECYGNVSETARELGIAERTLWNKITKYGINPEQYRDAGR